MALALETRMFSPVDSNLARVQLPAPELIDDRELARCIGGAETLVQVEGKYYWHTPGMGYRPYE
jgi:hypothetical protein